MTERVTWAIRPRLPVVWALVVPAMPAASAPQFVAADEDGDPDRAGTVPDDPLEPYVSGPASVGGIRIGRVTSPDAVHADLGIATSGSVCLTGDPRPYTSEPTSDPPSTQDLYDCPAPAAAGLSYLVIAANPAAHGVRVCQHPAAR